MTLFLSGALAIGIGSLIGWLVVRGGAPNAAPAAAPRSRSTADTTALLASWSLQPRNTEFLGPWQEASIDGVRVGFIVGDRLQIHAGGFDPDGEQLTGLYLVQVSDSRPLPSRASQRDCQFLDEAGRELADRFYQLAGTAPDCPDLRDPRVRSALLSLSPSVIELGFYEQDGAWLRVDTELATPASVADDVRQLVQVVHALREVPVEV